MTSSPTLSSRKWADSAKSENTGPIGIAKAPGAVTIVGGSHFGSSSLGSKRCPAVEIPAHRIDAFGPVLVQDEFAEPRMAFEMQSEQILDFPFVPVERRTVDKIDDRRHGRTIGVEFKLDMDPRRFGILVEDVDQRPACVRRLFDDERRECKIEVAREPLADVAQLGGSAFDTASTLCFVKRRDNVSLPAAATELRECSPRRPRPPRCDRAWSLRSLSLPSRSPPP